MKTVLLALLIGVSLASATNAADSISLLSYNLNRFFDDMADGREKVASTKHYQARLKITADKILHQFGAPAIIALQEIENLRVLNDLSERIRLLGGPQYRAILLEGNDGSGIDVGYLVSPEINITDSRQLFQDRLLASGNTPLFSRPPLLLEVCRQQCISVLNLHLRSMRGLRTNSKGRKVALKRKQQAETLASWIDGFQSRHPERFLVLVGDFNALQPADEYVDVVGILIGNPNNHGKHYRGRDNIKRDLIDLTRKIPLTQRYSYVYKGRRQILDYMLSSENFAPKLQSIGFSDIDRRISDHAGLLVEFSF